MTGPGTADERAALYERLRNDPDEAIRKAREGLALDASQTGLTMILARLQIDRGELEPADVDDATWHGAIRTALAEPYLVQERVAIPDLLPLLHERLG